MGIVESYRGRGIRAADSLHTLSRMIHRDPLHPSRNGGSSREWNEFHKAYIWRLPNTSGRWNFHRVGGPAYENDDMVAWYEHGKLHRVDGPARVTRDKQEWWLNGVRHRVDGPAVSSPECEAWWVDGQLHRKDGPAIVHADGSESWYWEGRYHRVDGPALTDLQGGEKWYQLGHLHRDNDLPAVISRDGTQLWYQHGRLHRENGPAIIKADGSQEWWVNNVEMSDEERAELHQQQFQDALKDSRLHRTESLAETLLGRR